MAFLAAKNGRDALPSPLILLDLPLGAAAQKNPLQKLMRRNAYRLGEVFSQAPVIPAPKGQLKGIGYYSSGELVNEPFDFWKKNLAHARLK